MKKIRKLMVLAMLTGILLCCGLAACTPTHQHTYATTLSYDETHHFYKATCGHDVVKDKEAHRFGAGVPDGKGNVVYTCSVCGYNKTEKSDSGDPQPSEVVLGVKEVLAQPAGKEVWVTGYYIGLTSEGRNSDEEVLLKDTTSDDVIGIRNVTGNFWNLGYRYGDELRLKATVGFDTDVNTPNKPYLTYAPENGAATTRIVSSGNNVTYALDDVVNVSNWTEMCNLFRTTSIGAYRYVCFTGTLYLHKYVGTDTDNFRLHMNASATNADGIKTDGKHSVCLRSDIMQANLGAEWKKLLFDAEKTGYPGTSFTGSFIALYTGGNGTYFQLVIPEQSFVNNAAEAARVEKETMVATVAEAFYRQGVQIQYDQTGTRRHINPSPEDAAVGNTLVLDCSSYVNACYNETFGVNVMPYAVTEKSPNTANFDAYAQSGGSNAGDVIGHWVTTDYPTEAQRRELLNSVRKNLRVGDVVCYRHGKSGGTSGHVMIYVGNDRFLHCTGTSYHYYNPSTQTPLDSYDQATPAERKNGAIQTLASKDVFENTSSRRYLFYQSTSDSVWSFGVIRPLNRGLSLTAETEKRKTAKSVDLEKIASVPQHGAVRVGDEITFTLQVKNFMSASVGDYVVTDKIPSGTVLKSCEGGTQNGSELRWELTLGAKETKNLTYTVTVAAGATKQIVSKGFQGNGVKSNDLKFTVSKLTAAQTTKLMTTANTLSSGVSFTNPIEMPKTLYKNALNRTLFDYTKVSAALTDVIDSDKNTFRTDTEISKMLVPDLYGGVDVKAGYVTDKTRARMITESYLVKGDIILAEYSGKSVVYVYLGESRLLAVYSQDKVSQVVEIAADPYRNILVTLISYDRYAVLRPSLVA